MNKMTRHAILTAFQENRLAIINIDLQYDFMSSYKFSDVVEKTARLTRHARFHRVPNVWVAYPSQHRAAREYPNLTTVRKFQKKADYGDRIFRSAGADPAETVAIKNQTDAFGYKQFALEEYLKKNRINTMIVTGIEATVCVKDTIRSGLLREHYNFIVAGDCVNVRDDVDYKDDILDGRQHLSKTMKSRLHMATSKEICAVLGHPAPSQDNCIFPAHAL